MSVRTHDSGGGRPNFPMAEDDPGWNPKTQGNKISGPRNYPDWERPDRQIAKGPMKGKINP